MDTTQGSSQTPEGTSQGWTLRPWHPSPDSPVEKTLLDTVTLSSGTLAQSPVALQPFMGKLMSVAPLAGSLWMLRTGVGRGAARDDRDRETEKQGEQLRNKRSRPWGAGEQAWASRTLCGAVPGWRGLRHTQGLGYFH